MAWLHFSPIGKAHESQVSFTNYKKAKLMIQYGTKEKVVENDYKMKIHPSVIE